MCQTSLSVCQKLYQKSELAFVQNFLYFSNWVDFFQNILLY
nr:MAG TPA: hypothetical protein [Caudoviricetes sp.]